MPDIQDRYYSNQRNELLRYVKRDDIRVLDLGCAAGYFGELLKNERNAEVWGVEAVPEIAEKAELRLDKVFCGDAENILDSLPDGHFDLICLNDFLEHVMWPENILVLCRKKLNKNGEILCSIPNMRYFRIMYALLFNKKWEYEDSGIMDKTHIRFFTVESIKNLFQRAGYQIVRLDGNDDFSKRKTKSWRYRIFVIFTLGKCADMRHGQFYCLAKAS